MKVAQLKAVLDEKEMEYIERWERPDYDHIDKKVIEIFYSDSQMNERGEGESTSMICVGGWKCAEKRMRQYGII